MQLGCMVSVSCRCTDLHDTLTLNPKPYTHLHSPS